MTRGLKISGLAKLCGVDARCFHNVVTKHKAEFPAPVGIDTRGNDLYDPEAALRYISGLRNKSKIRNGAEQALAELLKQKEAEKPAGMKKAVRRAPKKPKPEKAVPSGPKPRAIEPPAPVEVETGPATDSGMDASQYLALVVKMRTAVRSACDRHQMCIEAGDAAGASSTLRTLGESFDVLGRAEKTLLKLAQDYRTLLPVDEVKHLVAKSYGNVRGKLLMLPQKLSYELCALDTPGKVQNRLEEEIRELLNDLAENPFGE